MSSDPPKIHSSLGGLLNSQSGFSPTGEMQNPAFVPDFSPTPDNPSVIQGLVALILMQNHLLFNMIFFLQSFLLLKILN